jgi:hypothetical protein
VEYGQAGAERVIAESFFGIFKLELEFWVKYKTRDQVKEVSWMTSRCFTIANGVIPM